MPSSGMTYFASAITIMLLAANTTDTTIVSTNKKRSDPRRVWRNEPPPKELPASPVDRFKSTSTISASAEII